MTEHRPNPYGTAHGHCSNMQHLQERRHVPAGTKIPYVVMFLRGTKILFVGDIQSTHSYYTRKRKILENHELKKKTRTFCIMRVRLDVQLG